MLWVLVAAAAEMQAVAPPPPDRTWMRANKKSGSRRRMDQDGAMIENLPHANGRAFASLDAYLAYLRDYAAPMDRPWWREVRPGVYRLETGNLRTGAAPQEATRAELERRFGFAR